MRDTIFRFCACILAVISPEIISAQTAAEPGPTIHATVNEVLLDLVVRDKRGKLVKNLSPGDVEIYEDGVKQQPLSMRLAAGHAVTEQVNGSGVSPAARTAPRPLRETKLVCIVLHNQSSQNLPMKKFTVEAIDEFLRNHLGPDTWIGVFSLGSRLVPLHSFTQNRDELIRAAAQGFTGLTASFADSAQAILNGSPNVDWIEGVNYGTSGGAIEHFSTGTLNTGVNNGANQTMGLAADAQRGDLEGQRRQFSGIEGMRQLDQVAAMIQDLATLPGHKTVLLLSPGLASAGDPELFGRLLDKANRANITVYSLDTNGLSENSNTQAANQALQHVASLSQSQATNEADPPNTSSVGKTGLIAEKVRQDDYLHDAVRKSDSQASLRALAEGTGGFLIGGTNDLRKPYQRMIEDIDSHYELVYRPTSDKYDGRLRKIDVRLARADLTVESRKGYFAIPDIKGSPALMPFEMAGLTALTADPKPHAFDFRSSGFQFRPENGSIEYGLVFEVPAGAMTATPQPAQKRNRLHVSVFAVVKDVNGQIVDKFGQDTPFEIPDESMAQIRTLPITYTHAVNLPPGRYTVEAAVLDREGNRASAASTPIDITETKGLGLSSILLARQIKSAKGQADGANPFEFGTSRVVPSLSAELDRGSQQYVYFVVYPDKANAEKPKIEVQFSVDGRMLAKRQADLPEPDASGAIPMIVSAIAAKPGDCEMKVTATQGGNSVAQSITYKVPAQ